MREQKNERTRERERWTKLVKMHAAVELFPGVLDVCILASLDGTGRPAMVWGEVARSAFLSKSKMKENKLQKGNSCWTLKGDEPRPATSFTIS